MTNVTESDLKRLEDLIPDRLDEFGRGQTEIKERLTTIEGRITVLETGQKALENGQRQIEIRLTVIETRLDEWKPSIQRTADLSEKVGELKNWKQARLVIATAFVSSIPSGIIGFEQKWTQTR